MLPKIIIPSVQNNQTMCSFTAVEPPVLTSHKTILNCFVRQSDHRHFLCIFKVAPQSNLRFLPLSKQYLIVLFGRVAIGIFYAFLRSLRSCIYLSSVSSSTGVIILGNLHLTWV